MLEVNQVESNRRQQECQPKRVKSNVESGRGHDSVQDWVTLKVSQSRGELDPMSLAGG